MARSHAYLLTAIWSDPDWVALSQGAQRAYMLLLSQPKLTMVGLLDYLPSRWARLAADTTFASVEADIAEIEASRFVLVDRDTDELLIRTFVRHESTATKVANQRWLKGLWRAWSGIGSRQLRADVALEIPTSVWESPKVTPPAEATQMRRSAQKLPPERSARTSPTFHEPRSTFHETPTAVPKQPGNSRGDAPNDAAAVDNSTFDQAVRLLTERELQRSPTRGPSVARHRQAVLAAKTNDHRDQAERWIQLNPDLTPEALADLLEPPATATNGRHAEPKRPTTPVHVAGAEPSPWLAPPPDVLAATRQRLAHPDKETPA